ncbi:MAG: F0F1 ATP synthase subunit beta, partial [Parachlamydiaceae bacterium]
MKNKEELKGKIVQVLGPVVDIEFPSQKLPAIYNAVVIKDPSKNIDLVCEVANHAGDNIARCIALSSTDGLVRGMEVIDTGAPVTVPVGESTLGRIFNLLGNPIDSLTAIPDHTPRLPIHREPPPLEDQLTKTIQYETGIKVIDLLCPF